MPIAAAQWFSGEKIGANLNNLQFFDDFEWVWRFIPQ